MSTTDRVEAMLGEVGLEDADEVRGLLLALQSTALTETPRPSAELAGRLAPAPHSAGPRRIRRRAVLGVTAAALTTVLGTGVAAAANELPGPAQSLVARFSEHFLPFDFPRPEQDQPGRSDDPPRSEEHPAGVPGAATPQDLSGSGAADDSRHHSAGEHHRPIHRVHDHVTEGAADSHHRSSGSGNGSGHGDGDKSGSSEGSGTSQHEGHGGSDDHSGEGDHGGQDDHGGKGDQGDDGDQGGKGSEGDDGGQGGKGSQGGGSDDSGGGHGGGDSGDGGGGGQGGQGDGGGSDG